TPRPSLGGELSIAAERQRVPKPLLGVDQQRLPLRRLAPPLRLCKAGAGGDHLRHLPPPFVFRPTRGQITAHQQDKRVVEVRIGQVRPQQQGFVITGRRFLQLPLVGQYSAEVDVSVSEFW